MAAMVAAACSSAAPESTAPSSTTTTATASTVAEATTPPTTEAAEELDQSLGPVAAPVRHAASTRPIYFVMPDRFENGDSSNDTAGLEGDKLVHGFDPTHHAWHHGGDLAGLTSRLDYLEGLGIGAIWITPPFTNRFVQGDGTAEGSSSSYHGYWQIDWTQIDPHLGSDDDMRAFIDEAHARDMHVYFDVVVNHTGDVISYAEDSYVYWAQSARPYRDADGNEFDPAEFVGAADFPALDPAVSFAYTPTFADPADATVKAPDWLNDVTLYHNRGNSTFQGESDTYGDFFGLDDLFTEHPRVVAGMIELHGDLIERFDVDGFRVDTMKHVNPEFWAEFAPAMHARAAELGKDDFYLFGEIFNTDPIVQSKHTGLGVDATLDFIMNDGLQRYVSGGSADTLTQAFDADDWFTDADNNASMQATFFGNHDMGRMGYLLDSALPGADDAELLARAKLGFDLLFLSRGVPVVYYGDEQGFTGDGGDQLARQDMFPSQTPAYLDDELIGTDATAADSNFDTSHPLYRHVAGLAALRASHPTLSTGAQIVHEPIGPVFAMSRIDRDERIEYVVLTNSNGSITVPARLPVLTASSTFSQIHARDGLTVAADSSGEILVEVPPLTTIILRAREPLTAPANAFDVTLQRPTPGAVIPTERYRIEAALSEDRWVEVTFAVSVDGAEPTVVGVDDNPPYRVYWNNSELPAETPITITATAADGSGRLHSAVADAMIGDR